MKNIADLRNEMFEIFLPLTSEELTNLSVNDLGALETITTTSGNTYLENERLIVIANENVYNLSRNDFTRFRINVLEGRCFTYSNYKPFFNLEDALAYSQTLEDEIVVITRNIYPDDDGDFTSEWFYVCILEA